MSSGSGTPDGVTNPFTIPNHIVTFVLPDGEINAVGLEIECLPLCTSKVYREHAADYWADEYDCHCEGTDGLACEECAEGDHDACSADGFYVYDMGPECRLEIDEKAGCWYAHMNDAVGKEHFSLGIDVRFKIHAHLSGTVDDGTEILVCQQPPSPEVSALEETIRALDVMLHSAQASHAWSELKHERQLFEANTTIWELREQIAALTKAVGSRPPTHEIRCDADEWHAKHPMSCDIDNCKVVSSDIAWSLMAETGSGSYVHTPAGWVKRTEAA